MGLMTKVQAQNYVYVHMVRGDIEYYYNRLPDIHKNLTKKGTPRLKVNRSQMEQSLIKYLTEIQGHFL